MIDVSLTSPVVVLIEQMIMLSVRALSERVRSSEPSSRMFIHSLGSPCVTFRSVISVISSSESAVTSEASSLPSIARSASAWEVAEVGSALVPSVETAASVLPGSAVEAVVSVVTAVVSTGAVLVAVGSDGLPPPAS